MSSVLGVGGLIAAPVMDDRDTAPATTARQQAAAPRSDTMPRPATTTAGPRRLSAGVDAEERPKLLLCRRTTVERGVCTVAIRAEG